MQHRKVLFLLSIIFLFTFNSINAQAQNATPSAKEREINVLIQRAETHYQKGLAALAENNFSRMRSEFDLAVDEMLVTGLDLHSDARLQRYYRELVDKIVQHQLNAKASNEQVIKDQRFEGTFINDIGRLTEKELQELAVKTPEQPQVKTSDFSFKTDLPPAVNQFINYFTIGKGRKTLEMGFTRSGRYRQYAEKVFEREGVPKDLIWLAQAESVWQPIATSPMAARGIWQFIPSTGERFGLRQNGFLDERLDPEKSTEAAARYLRFLGDRYAGDWLLAMAAYNMGENGLDKAITRCGYADFWELREQGFLPQETKNYVPAILAIIAIAKQPDAYKVEMKPESSWQFDRIKIAIANDTSLNIVADTLAISPNTLYSFNPELLSNAIPFNGYSLRIPKGIDAKRLTLLMGEGQGEYKTRNVVKKKPKNN
ncbi:MAG: lytic transglycosylase domain-containing protein [Acidobacteria bacterium]|nr:lytic transglycosylase domain-containing protein [Acidobacteriota bacterium]